MFNRVRYGPLKSVLYPGSHFVYSLNNHGDLNVVTEFGEVGAVVADPQVRLVLFLQVTREEKDQRLNCRLFSVASIDAFASFYAVQHWHIHVQNYNREEVFLVTVNLLESITAICSFEDLKVGAKLQAISHKQEVCIIDQQQPWFDDVLFKRIIAPSLP